MGRRRRHRIRAGWQPPERSRGRTPTQWRDFTGQIEHRFVSVLAKFDIGEGAQAERDLVELATWWTEGVGQSANLAGLVPALVCSYLCREIEQVWERGWQPADVPPVVTKHLGPTHGHLVVAAIAEEAETYRSRRRQLPAWMDQLDQIGAVLHWGPDTDHLAQLAEGRDLSREALLRTAFEVIVMLHHLPAIPLLGPPPSKWDSSAALDAVLAWRKDGGQEAVRHLERIRSLLAKAESTEFDEEADAFTTKAQELMTRHSIDDALLAAHASGKCTGERPSAFRIGIDDPYAQTKAILLASIAEASRCRAVWSKKFGFSTVFGFAGDLASVELLYTSLLLQARSAMLRAGDRGQSARRSSFRRSFLLGFANRIGRRLEEVANAAVADAVEERGNALLPVLAERSRKVEEHRNEAFPDLDHFRSTMGDWSGWASGVAAADAAVIARGPSIEDGLTST